MKRLSLLLLAFLFLACGDRAEKPEKLLSERDMENVLYDLSLLQAMRSYTPATLNDNDVDAKSYIYRKYDIDSATLSQNHIYYAADLEKYENLQKKVAERLKKDKVKWQKETGKQNTKKALKAKSSTSIKTLGTGRAKMTP